MSRKEEENKKRKKGGGSDEASAERKSMQLREFSIIWYSEILGQGPPRQNEEEEGESETEQQVKEAGDCLLK